MYKWKRDRGGGDGGGITSDGNKKKSAPVLKWSGESNPHIRGHGVPAALTKHSLPTWYKVLGTQLICLWEAKSKQLVAAVKRGALTDPDVNALLEDCGACIKTLACFVSTTKGQPSKAQVLPFFSCAAEIRKPACSLSHGPLKPC